MSALIPAPAGALAAASLTTNTRRAYSGALARLDSFLAGRALEDGALAAYLATLHDAGRAPAGAVRRSRRRSSGPNSPASRRPPVRQRIACSPASGGKLGTGAAGKSLGSDGNRPMQSGPLRRIGGARLPGSAMRQSSPSCPMQCSGFPKSPPSIAPTLPPKRTGPAGSPSGTRKQTKRARAPCSSSARRPCGACRFG